MESGTQPRMERRLGLLPATALNMANMLGAGPFITLSTLMSALGGPQSMLGWLVALLVAVCDGMVWAELGAAFPGSGGTYRYLREGFGARWGPFLSFLFLAQLLVSGPLEIATGYIGFARYLDYLWPGVVQGGDLTLRGGLVVVLLGLGNIALLYRRIGGISRMMVALWIGVMLTVAAVIVTGVPRFNPAVAFDLPPGAWSFGWGFALGLGAAARTGVYDYLGYYDICYLGDEVRNPGKTIPRSILISVVSVAVIYMAINLSIVGVIPWREFVPESGHPEAMFIASAFMERVHGPGLARAFTVMVLWTCVGSVVALLLGYSRIPYAAAVEGGFFRVFARLHPTQGFPHVGLVLIGLLAVAGAFLPLGVAIDALIALRILVQFLGQTVALVLLRRRRPDLERPYRVWLYPLPLLVGSAGWLFVFGTAGKAVLTGVALSFAAGAALYAAWSATRKA